MKPDPFVLIETMRCEGGIPLLERHLARLVASAKELGFPLDEAALRDRIHQTVGMLTAELPHRLRLTLDGSGETTLDATPLSKPAEGRLRVCLSPCVMDSTDLFLRHKTTRRQVYEAEFARIQSEGYDEVLFTNERAELTEGSRSNLYVRINGLLFTPAIACGVLPGVYRSYMLDTGKATEAVLGVAALAGAEELYLSNAVMGLRRAVPEISL